MFQNSWISYIIEYRLILGCTTYIFIFAFAIFRLKHTGHIMAPHPTQVLLNLLQRQVTFSMVSNIASCLVWPLNCGTIF
jgi:hypothetical protein